MRTRTFRFLLILPALTALAMVAAAGGPARAGEVYVGVELPLPGVWIESVYEHRHRSAPYRIERLEREAERLERATDRLEDVAEDVAYRARFRGQRYALERIERLERDADKLSRLVERRRFGGGRFVERLERVERSYSIALDAAGGLLRYPALRYQFQRVAERLERVRYAAGFVPARGHGRRYHEGPRWYGRHGRHGEGDDDRYDDYYGDRDDDDRRGPPHHRRGRIVIGGEFELDDD